MALLISKNPLWHGYTMFQVIISLVIMFIDARFSLSTLIATINRDVIQQPLDCLKICVPSIIFIFQNNLLYVALSHLEAVTFQVGIYHENIKNKWSLPPPHMTMRITFQIHPFNWLITINGLNVNAFLNPISNSYKEKLVKI